MKLSEAIRLGIGLFPQGRTFCDCTIGTAVAAIGKHRLYNEEYRYESIEMVATKEWPFLTREVAHPERGISYRLIDCISLLNGILELHWSRERIADWVATIEPKENHDLQPEPKQAISYMPDCQNVGAGGVD